MIQRLVQGIKSRRTLATMLGLAVVGGLVGATIAQRTPLKYQATAIVTFADATPTAPGIVAAPTHPVNTGTFAQLVDSPNVLQKVVAQTDGAITAKQLAKELAARELSGGRVAVRVTDHRAANAARYANLAAVAFADEMVAVTTAPGGAPDVSGEQTGVAAVPRSAQSQPWAPNIIIGVLAGFILGSFAGLLRYREAGNVEP